MRVNVKLFAVARECAGAGEVGLELPAASTVNEALVALQRQFPSLVDILPKAACAVNLSYVRRDEILEDGDELAVIPPVSGG